MGSYLFAGTQERTCAFSQDHALGFEPLGERKSPKASGMGSKLPPLQGKRAFAHESVDIDINLD
ncbi:MAG: hypothetical protein SGPRY_000904, partial [Prymnesium sp.]